MVLAVLEEEVLEEGDPQEVASGGEAAEAGKFIDPSYPRCNQPQEYSVFLKMDPKIKGVHLAQLELGFFFVR